VECGLGIGSDRPGAVYVPWFTFRARLMLWHLWRVVISSVFNLILNFGRNHPAGFKVKLYVYSVLGNSCTHGV
jgi:hypothetical protein